MSPGFGVYAARWSREHLGGGREEACAEVVGPVAGIGGEVLAPLCPKVLVQVVVVAPILVTSRPHPLPRILRLLKAESGKRGNEYDGFPAPPGDGRGLVITV